MKIVAGKNQKTVRFNELQVGDVFQTVKSKRFCMKLYPRTYYTHTFGSFNAVELEGGLLYGMPSDEEVILIDCELVVK